MIQKKSILFTTLLAMPLAISAADGDDDPVKNMTLPTVSISSLKEMFDYKTLTSSASSVNIMDVQLRGLKNPKLLSSIVPNLHMPDYGSAMTSSIYMRGFGSRIDNPVVALYVDDVPVIDKNNFDFDFFDVNKVMVMRGPQSTLYGRNSMMGVMSVNTLSPSYAKGSTVNLEYGKNNWVNARVRHYKGPFGFSLGYRHSDGEFRNDYNGEKIDKYDALSFRGKYAANVARNLMLENTVSASWLKQGGYAYGQLKNDTLFNPNYNEPCTYKRISLMDGLKLKWQTSRFLLSSVTSFQWLDDNVHFDNDFTKEDYFTFTQKQKQYAVTEEVIFRPMKHPDWWNHQTGLFAMYKHNKMNAPVDMRQEGINQFIVNPVNKVFEDLKASKPNMPFLLKLGFSDPSFLIRDDFRLETSDLALFHESYFTFDQWMITAGLRVDWERNSMAYDCDASAGYDLNAIAAFPFPGFPISDKVNTLYGGHLHKSYLEVLPKLSVSYDFTPMLWFPNSLRVFASVAKGFKAGGYNTQIFSDIVREHLRADLMASIADKNSMAAQFMPKVDADAVKSENTTYKPETCMNYEIGANFSTFNEHGLLNVSATGYLVNSNNMQITVMPDANSTGRVMANAGKANSLGFELDAKLQTTYDWDFSASFGYTNAYFRQYADGGNDYKDNKVPYSPQSTLMVRAARRIYIGDNILTIGVEGNQIGKIYWNEANTRHQNNYFMLNADVNYRMGGLTLYGRAENITSTRYNTFYFKSIGNEFFQKGKPIQWSVGAIYLF